MGTHIHQNQYSNKQAVMLWISSVCLLSVVLASADEATTEEILTTTKEILTTTAEPYVDFGCWNNKVPQKMDNLEKTDKRLDKHNYKKRTDAINKCYQVARDAGYDFFGLGNKGQCWAGYGDIYQTYSQPKSCPKTGKGKYGVVNVYMINKSEKADETTLPPTTTEPPTTTYPTTIPYTTPEPTTMIITTQEETEMISCGSKTCRSDTQYCGGTFTNHCSNLKSKGSMCLYSKECYSKSCKWFWSKFSVRCA